MLCTFSCLSWILMSLKARIFQVMSLFLMALQTRNQRFPNQFCSHTLDASEGITAQNVTKSNTYTYTQMHTASWLHLLFSMFNTRTQESPSPASLPSISAALARKPVAWVGSRPLHQPPLPQQQATGVALGMAGLFHIDPGLTGFPTHRLFFLLSTGFPSFILVHLWKKKKKKTWVCGSFWD